MRRINGFDKLARVYRLLEYGSFGPLLWRTRIALLPRMLQARRALVLGDGDGRFTAALLRANHNVHVVAVDASAAMLDRLASRVRAQGHASRVQIVHADAREFSIAGTFDLVCTHFFLDCLADAEVQALARRCAPHMQAGGQWIVSEFAVPHGWVHVPAASLVRLLYAVFRAATGLHAQQLPDYAAQLRRSGFTCEAVQCRLFGVLRSELWQMSAMGVPASKDA